MNAGVLRRPLNASSMAVNWRVFLGRRSCCTVFAAPAATYGAGTGLSGESPGKSLYSAGWQFPSSGA